MLSRVALQGAKPAWTMVSLTTPSMGVISEVTFERGSAATVAKYSSLKPTAFANSGVIVC